MPPKVKICLSLAVAVVALAGWFFMRHLGQVGPQWAIVFLGPFMVVSLWIFPEVMRNRSNGRLSRHTLRDAKR